MNEKPCGILVSSDSDLYQDLGRRLASMVEITDRTGDCFSAYSLAREKQPDLIFLDMSGQRQELINLGKRLRKNLPDARIFCIDAKKDPDLILAGFRMGFADFFQYPFNGTDVEDLVRKSLDPGTAGSQGELTTIFSLKGGVGVTSVAINLADQISTLTRDRVLLLDLNLFFGDICSYLNLKTAYSPYDFIRDMDRMDKDLLFSSLYCHKEGFHILTVPDEISDSDSITGEQIMGMLSVLRRHFDHIIVDCPHDLTSRTLEVCLASDKILVLAHQNITSAKSVQSVINCFDDLNVPKDRVKIVINRYLKTEDMEDKDLEQIFAKRIYFKLTNNYLSFTRAANKGLTMDEAANNSRSTEEIRCLAEKLAGIKTPEPSGWRRILTRGLRR